MCALYLDKGAPHASVVNVCLLTIISILASAILKSFFSFNNGIGLSSFMHLLVSVVDGSVTPVLFLVPKQLFITSLFLHFRYYHAYPLLQRLPTLFHLLTNSPWPIFLRIPHLEIVRHCLVIIYHIGLDVKRALSLKISPP